MDAKYALIYALFNLTRMLKTVVQISENIKNSRFGLRRLMHKTLHDAIKRLCCSFEAFKFGIYICLVFIFACENEKYCTFLRNTFRENFQAGVACHDQPKWLRITFKSRCLLYVCPYVYINVVQIWFHCKRCDRIACFALFVVGPTFLPYTVFACETTLPQYFHNVCACEYVIYITHVLCAHVYPAGGYMLVDA